MADYIKMLREDPLNAWYYFQGTIRMWAYNNAKWLLRPHITAQFEWRKKELKNVMIIKLVYTVDVKPLICFLQIKHVG